MRLVGVVLSELFFSLGRACTWLVPFDSSRLHPENRPRRTSLTQKVAGILRWSLDRDLRLISVEQIQEPGRARRVLTASQRPEVATGRALQSNAPTLPLAVKLNAPVDVSDFALPYIVELLRDNIEEVHRLLGRLDGDVFEVSFLMGAQNACVLEFGPSCSLFSPCNSSPRAVSRCVGHTVRTEGGPA